jgi:hypothetical protein
MQGSTAIPGLVLRLALSCASLVLSCGRLILRFSCLANGFVLANGLVL